MHHSDTVGQTQGISRLVGHDDQRLASGFDESPKQPGNTVARGQVKGIYRRFKEKRAAELQLCGQRETRDERDLYT